MGCFSTGSITDFQNDEGYMNFYDNFAGPVKQRRCTDVTFLIIKVVFLVGLFGMAGYCIAYGDLYRLFLGYDNCGNVCGRINPPIEESGFECYGGDFTAKKYLKYDTTNELNVFDVKHIQRECVENCSMYPGYFAFLNKCFPTKTNDMETLSEHGSFKNEPWASQDHDYITGITSSKEDSPDETVTNVGDFYEQMAEDMGNVWPYLIYLCLIAFALSFLFLLVFRYAAAVMVWMSLVLIVLITLGSSAFLWIMYAQSDLSIILAVIMSSIAALFLLTILVMRKKICLVIQLFEEAAKALIDMPLLFIQPIWTFLALGVIIISWLYLALWIQSAGELTHVPGTDLKYYYKKDMAMKVTRWYNITAVVWMSQFVIACQHMVLAGAVSNWYFTRDKSQIKTPIWTSFTNLVRYHLGSVLLTSLVITIVGLIKFLLKLVERTAKRSNNIFLRLASCCFRYILNLFERFFNMISRNAYVQIAIYGKGFCPSALRSLKLLYNNVLNIAAINFVGDFVLFIVKFFIMFVTLLTSAFVFWNMENLHFVWLPMVLTAVFTFIIAHAFISILEMIIDSIFICFCEDCEMNDGINKPYFMNRGLMEFVENSKKVLKIKDKEDTTFQPSAPPM